MKKTSLALLLMTSATFALGYEMPSELQGNYAYPGEKGACQSKNYSLVITKVGVDANEYNCKIIGKPKGDSGRYTVPMKCSSEDGSSKSNTKFELIGNNLKSDQVEYLRCEASIAASSATSNASKSTTQTCTVRQGYAGVASYHDSALKKVATEPIRDFDGYEFKKEKEITSGKNKIFGGKLIRYDGKVSAGNYVFADDWECK